MTSSEHVTPGWRIVAGQESRDLWISGRGPVLLFAFSVLLSVITYLSATNQVLNFLEQREAVHLTLQVAVAVGVLVTLLVGADAISGERERGTLESLLLTPVSRRGIVAGKLVAALTLWLATFLVGVPYLLVLATGVALVGKALLLGFVLGTVLAVALAALGLLISALSASNKVSMSVSFFLLLALFVPSQLPPMPTSWIDEVLTRVNPLGSAMHYSSAVLVKGHSWEQDLSYLISPLAALVIVVGALIIVSPRIVRLNGGSGQ
ncbi:ABC transporter [Kibdelosporangium aridum]|uniref:ABC transporter n=1 Tax=Kibdelosporangium aridum TaxID=2030 RepID=A0A428ZBW1_KIBAR|nr:ABC transporter permease subunit [Kibdelosporangium aridum]RSM85511.1 ABC transporter [Kibdelosporangium aridum]